MSLQYDIACIILSVFISLILILCYDIFYYFNFSHNHSSRARENKPYSEDILLNWGMLIAKAQAAHVYYLKRSAKCRRGRSPPSSCASSSSSSYNKQQNKDIKSIQRLRAWASEPKFSTMDDID